MLNITNTPPPYVMPPMIQADYLYGYDAPPSQGTYILINGVWVQFDEAQEIPRGKSPQFMKPFIQGNMKRVGCGIYELAIDGVIQNVLNPNRFISLIGLPYKPKACVYWVTR